MSVVQRADGETLGIRVLRTGDLDEATRAAVISVCVDAHREPSFVKLFTWLPDDGLHVLAYADRLIGHAVVTTRWLQPLGLPLLRTAYVDAVAVSPAHQGRGVGSSLMRHLASAIGDYDIAGLETERVALYERLGWEQWRGPLAGRTEHGLIATPDQRGVMILRLPRTPQLDPETLLTIEAHTTRIW
jgi:aminoglycoside 2'-N-acetyltransferase I